MGMYVFVASAFITISTDVFSHIDGMFAILVPVSLSPLIITLFWAENKAKASGLVRNHRRTSSSGSKPDQDSSFSAKARYLAEQLDVIGLTLLGGSVALILLPLTLSQTSKSGWKNGEGFYYLILRKHLTVCLLDQCSPNYRYAPLWFRFALRFRLVGFPIC